MYNEHKQHGSVAIEFAAIFVLFFSLFYGTIAFGLPALARLAFQHHAAEASRAAIRVDPNVEETLFLGRVSQQVDDLITNSWIPASWRDGCKDLGESDNEDEPPEWTALPNTAYGYWRQEPDPAPGANPRYQINICMQTSDPIVPQLVIGDLSFPPYVDEDTGKSWVRGYTITTL